MLIVYAASVISVMFEVCDVLNGCDFLDYCYFRSKVLIMSLVTVKFMYTCLWAKLQYSYILRCFVRKLATFFSN